MTALVTSSDIEANDGIALPTVGDIIDGRYRIEERHATGGMGTVFRATHLQLERQVALKVASCVVVRLPGGPERFLREARLATQVQSDHVAAVFDVGVLPSGMPFLVMEWLDGIDLGAVLKISGPMTVETAVDCLLQACEALADVHRQGIVHRDLKPSNLFLVRDSDGNARIKLIDFGVSKMIGLGRDLGRITQAGTAIGSPPYMSPEQMGIEEVADERTDVWGLGVVLYELLTGELPFRGNTLNDILAAILLRPHVKASDHAPHIPAGIDAVIARCLDTEQAKRFASVGELAAALAPFGARAVAPSTLRLTPTAISAGSSRAPPARTSLGSLTTTFHTAARLTPVPRVREGWLRGRRGVALGACLGLLVAVPMMVMKASPAATSPAVLPAASHDVLPASVNTELLPKQNPAPTPEVEDASADTGVPADAGAAGADAF